MRRAFITALTLALILGITEGQSRQDNTTRLGNLQLSGAQSANWRHEQCRYRHLEDGWGWSYHEISLTIRCAVVHFPVYGGFDKALSVAQCESGLNELAWNPNGHGGVYQQAISSWPYRLRTLGPPWWGLRPSIFNGRSNVVVSIRQAHLYGWGAWTCA
jgi:hypothetical protein